MINYFFIFSLIISIIYSIFTGNINNIQKAILTLPKEAILIFFKTSVVLIFFQGIIQIGLDSGILNWVCRWVKKFITPLFKNIKKEETLDYISLNLVCNFFGIAGATLAGMKAMKLLDEKNGVATPEMIMFLSLNTSGFCIFPQSIISLREAYLSTDSTGVLVPCLLLSFSGMIFAIILNKLLVKYES